MEEEFLTQGGQLITNGTRSHEDTIPWIARGQLLHFLADDSALLQGHYFVEAIKQEQHFSLDEQLLEELTADVNPLVVEQSSDIGKEGAISMTLPLLTEAMQRYIERE